MDNRGRLYLGLVITMLLAIGLVFLQRGCMKRGDPGLRLDLVVLDPNDMPIRQAKVQRTYAPGWYDVDRMGTVRLLGVPLRAGATPSREELFAAFRVQADEFAARSTERWEAERIAEGHWRVTARLEPFGTFRLGLLPVELPDVEAWLEPDPAGRIEPIGGYGIARKGQGASYRIFEGVEELIIRTQGSRGVAMRREVLKAPNIKATFQHMALPRPSKEILGQIRAPAGSDVPSLAGRLTVLQLPDEEGGRVLPMPDVRIDPDGRFIISYAGAGRYRLKADCPFLENIQPLETEGGREVEMEAKAVRAWLRMPAPSEDESLALSVSDARGREVGMGDARVARDGQWFVPVRSFGSVEVHISRRGSDLAAPAEARLSTVIDDFGPKDLPAPPLGEIPHGTLRLALPDAEREGARGATLEFSSGRTATWLPSISPHLDVPHLAEGTHTLRVTFANESLAIILATVKIEAGKTTSFAPTRAPGGHFELEAPAPQEAGVHPHLRIRDGHSPYAGDYDVPLIWLRDKLRWRTAFRLLPGSYQAELHGDFPGRSLTFEIAARPAP